jgi:LDH2 family malate/lactate/ureidoglycolate dehydrogenase
MQVSMVELKAALKRCFEAAGYFVGNYEDAANMIVWLENHGLQGLAELERTLPYIKDDSEKELSTLIYQDNTTAIIDCHNCSSLNNIPAAVDLAYAKSLVSGIATVTVHNCHNRMFVLKAITDCGRRGISAVAYWKNGTTRSREHTVSIGAGHRYPSYQEALTDLCVDSTNSQSLVIICSAQVDLKTSLQQSAQYREIKKISSGRIENHKEYCIDHGITISAQLWQKINQIGDQVLVESSDQSRQGAG